MQEAMLGRRTRAAAAVLDGYLYVIGGNDGKMTLDTGEWCDYKLHLTSGTQKQSHFL